MSSSSVFIVVPAYNEAGILETVLKDLSMYPYQVLLIDDGSEDGTAAIAEKYKVGLLRHRLNLGQGAALQTGMAAAQRANASIVVHFDADGQHAAAEIEDFIEPLLKDRCDIVFGSRFMDRSGKTVVPGAKRIALHAGRYFNFLLTGILLSDAHNGFRALNRKALEALELSQHGMAHATEILMQVRAHRLRYLELPVTVRYTSYSRNKGQSLWNSINILFDLLIKKKRK